MWQRRTVNGRPMTMDIAWSVLSAPPDEVSAIATMPSVQHQKTFCQCGTRGPDRPDAEMMSSVIEPESDDVRKKMTRPNQRQSWSVPVRFLYGSIRR